MSNSSSNSSPQHGVHFDNTKENFQRCITGALRGETNGKGLWTLASNIGSIPTELIHDAVKVFVSYLQESRIPDFPTKTLISMGKASLYGLRTLIKANEADLVERDRILELIYKNWYRKLDFTRSLLSHIRRAGDAAETNKCFEIAIELLYSIMKSNGSSFVETLDNKSAELLISYIWFYYPVEVQAQPTRAYLSICHALSKPEWTSMNYISALFDVIEDVQGERAQAEAIQRRIVAGMNYALSIPSVPVQKWFILDANALLITRVSDYFRRLHIDLLFEQDFLSALLRAANHCRSTVSRSTHVESTEVVYACVGILNAVFHILEENPDLLRKALRLGLLQIIITFSERYKIEDDSPYRSSLTQTLSAYISFITHMLDDIRVSFLVMESLKKEAPEILSRMSSKSLVSHLWWFMEHVLRERMYIFRIHTIPEKIARCDACSVRSQKSSMKRCGRCLCAIYCSRECQMKDWKEQEHRLVCGKDWVAKRGPVKKFNPKKEMPKCIALASIISYCTSELYRKANFRPLYDLFLINPGVSNDFGGKPVHNREEFLRNVGADHHRSLMAALNSAYSHIKETYEGKGTLCVSMNKSGKKTIFNFFAFSVILDGTRDLPLAILPSDGRTIIESLPSLVVMVEEEIQRSSANYSKSNIDKAVLKIFLDKSSRGRSAWLYWLIWDRAYSVTVQL